MSFHLDAEQREIKGAMSPAQEPPRVSPASSDNTFSLPSSASSRILYDTPCEVCRDHSSGKHYGVFACDGCAGFFKRSVRRTRQYACKARRGACVVDKLRRNQCRACRLDKCLRAGMNREAVQHERGPRSATLRRRPAPAAAPGDVCEAAARLLFLNVRWARQLPGFAALPAEDRVLLLQRSWRELFALGAGPLLAALGARALAPGAAALAAPAALVLRARPDAQELACLRAAVLFAPPPAPRLRSPQAVAELCRDATRVLSEYTTMAYPDMPLRFGSLLLLLPTLKTVSGTVIEELFFRDTIGNIPIERIISDMYKSEEAAP